MNHYATSMYRDKAGRHFWFAKQLLQRGYDVTVFCATTFLNGNDVIDTEGRKYTIKKLDGVPFIFVKTVRSTGNGIKRIFNMGLFYKNLFPVSNTIAKQYGEPDIIIASSVHPLTLVAGIQIAKKFKVPCICEVRDLWPEAIFTFGLVKEKSIFGRILIAGEHWIYKHSDALIFTKEGDTDYLKERKWTTIQGGDIDLNKCHYINNGVDIAAYDNNIKCERLNDLDLLDENKFNVVYAGTIRPGNNVGNLLDVAAILKKHKKYRNVQFLIYGNGMQLQELQVRARNEDLENVKLKGYIERKYIPFILSHSSVNILNYTQDKYNWTRGNSSNKLFEYMASGKPVISNVHMGYSIIKKYNFGVELAEDTPEALAYEIMKFHDMDKEKLAELGHNARNGVADFDFKVLTEKLINVINTVKNNDNE
jgi:Glycosyltransferase